mgnify:CR=1 FL=1
MLSKFSTAIQKATFRIRGQLIMKYVEEIDYIHNLSQSRKENYRQEKITELVQYSTEHVEYYKTQLLKSEYSFSRYSEIDFYNWLPVLTKNYMRKNLSAFISADKDISFSETMTSGSTGASTKFLVAPQSAERWYAAKIWHRHQFGVELGDPCLWIWGRMPRNPQLINRLRASLSDLLRYEYRISAFDINVQTAKEFCGLITNKKIKVIYAYTSALINLVNVAKKNNFRLKSYLKLIVCTAELLDDDQRYILQQFFGCPVVSEYGGAEFGIVATEGFENKFKLHSQSLDLLLGATGDQNYRNIIITNYHNFKMPLLKYDTGDLAFSRNFNEDGNLLEDPPFERIAGRVYSSFKLLDGTIVHGEVINYAVKSVFLENSMQSSEHQFHQYSENHFKLTLVDSYVDVYDKDRLKQIFIDKLSLLSPSFAEIILDIEIVDHIPLTTGGKRIYITSDVHI